MRLKKGMKFKGGVIGSEYDRVREATRAAGCTCCPHSECIHEDEYCEHRCPVHAPSIIKAQGEELTRVRIHLRSLINFAYPEGLGE